MISTTSRTLIDRFNDESGTNAVAPACGAALGRRRRLLRVEPVDACTQLPVLVPQLPVRLGEPLEPLGDAAAPASSAHDGDQNGRTGQQPEKGQQNSYLIERLATVSTA